MPAALLLVMAVWKACWKSELVMTPLAGLYCSLRRAS